METPTRRGGEACVVRLDEQFREDESKLRRMAINLPDGGVIPLDSVADIYESLGPNTINRELSLGATGVWAISSGGKE